MVMLFVSKSFVCFFPLFQRKWHEKKINVHCFSEIFIFYQFLIGLPPVWFLSPDTQCIWLCICITKKPLGLPFFYILTKKCFVNFTLIYKLYEIKIHKISTFSKIEKTVLHLKYAYNALLFILNFMPVNYRTVWPHNYPFDLFISEFQIWILNCI